MLTVFLNSFSCRLHWSRFINDLILATSHITCIITSPSIRRLSDSISFDYKHLRDERQWTTIDGKNESYTLKKYQLKEYIGNHPSTLVRSYYQGLRLQFRPTLRRCVSDDFFQYNQGLHVRSCEYLELVVSASAVLADAGVDVCGADWDVEAPEKLLMKLLMIAKSTYFQIPLCQWGFSPNFLCCLRYVKLRSAIDGFFVGVLLTFHFLCFYWHWSWRGLDRS